MSNKESNKDFQTDWAFKDDFIKHIHISEAKSGLNGYYCLGCKKEMQAVKGQIREHYFRHHAKDVDKNNTECVVANRKYRELIARDILQRLKRLKVPAIYKYPPKNSDGAPNLLEQSKTIQAFSVKSELTFYEDEECNVRYGQNPNIEERHLLIRPDISFFNEKQEPILLVEFVVTHKIDNEKRAKLKRLGLNTVQIIIPKKNEEEIEKALKSSTKVKWVYNEVEANTNYIYTSKSSSSGVWEIDDEQSRIFEESYKCRANQISNLIRSVKRIMDSQSYKRAEQHFESEISRVENATKAEKEGLEQMEGRFKREIFARYKDKFDQLAREQEDFQERRANLEEQSKDLETRYFNKKREFDQEETDLSRSIAEHSDIGEASERIRAEFRSRKIKIGEESKSIKNAIDRIRREIKDLPKAFKQLEIEAKGRFDSDRAKLEKEERDIGTEMDKFGQYAKEEESSIEIEFEELRKRTIESINNRDSKGNSEVSKRIKAILDVGRISTNYDERLETFKRYRTYLELARRRAWEK
ncbi:hypothetical protein [Neotamlana laminarinivorans]|uniref:Uncharacterized protein n=1 Tax=Neotamlana laminarinivorans TaxID=2883124 RepID=A0A9X1L596_9FLAO|nr:hypothetical protein [Tamlana laminarinivorans]MCB4800249.1 hypothetical protein [Tamlana laminarinivorans]